MEAQAATRMRVYSKNLVFEYPVPPTHTKREREGERVRAQYRRH